MEKKEIINLTFPNAEGNDISLSDFRGKVVYIDIWLPGAVRVKRRCRL